MSIGYCDIWVGGGVDQGWVGTVLPKVLLRWMPSRLSPLAVAAVSAAAAADDDDGGGGGGGGVDDDDDDNDNYDNYDDNDDAFLGLTHLLQQTPRGTWSMYRALDLPHSAASTCEPRVGQQYSEMKCPLATAIFGLGRSRSKLGWHCFTKGAAAVDALAAVATRCRRRECCCCCC